MRNPLLLGLLLAAPAAAQPITQPSSCEVTISRAPDEVREAIEAWVAAEPQCSTTIDVRVVATEGGFYIFARDGAGRIRERVVPDAQSAGVLVASWVADDLIAATPPPPPAAPPEPPPMPPGAAPVIAPSPTGVVARAPSPQPRGRWLTLGGIWQMHGGGAGGLRAELDIVRRGRWTLGGVVAGSSADLTMNDASSAGYITTIDVRALAQLSRTSTLGKQWDLRLAVGAGVMSTRASGEFRGDEIEAHGVFPTAEASILFSRELRGGWAFAAGPIVTWYSQAYKVEDDFGGMLTMSERDVEVMGFGGFRRRL